MIVYSVLYMASVPPSLHQLPTFPKEVKKTTFPRTKDAINAWMGDCLGTPLSSMVKEEMDINLHTNYLLYFLVTFLIE